MLLVSLIVNPFGEKMRLVRVYIETSFCYVEQCIAKCSTKEVRKISGL